MTQGDPIPPPPPPDPMIPPPGAPTPPPPGAAPTPPVSYATPWPPGQVETNPEARQWAMFAHLAALAMFIIPFAGNIVGPLVVWMVKKDQFPFVNDQGKESLNFQITVTIALVAVLIVGFVSICIGGIGFFLVPAVGIAGAVMAAMGAMEANKGVAYRYPFALRLIK